MDKKRISILIVAVLLIVVAGYTATSQDYGPAWLRWKLGMGEHPVTAGGPGAYSAEDAPVVYDSERWAVQIDRRSACDNRPGLKMMYVWVWDADGEPIKDVEVRWTVAYGKGIVSDRARWVGVTASDGHVFWDHPSSPTYYTLLVEGEKLVSNISTVLGYEYCNPSSWPPTGYIRGWRPINRPGVYSYHVYITEKADAQQ